jgi:predicted nucleic acid-binding protein
MEGYFGTPAGGPRFGEPHIGGKLGTEGVGRLRVVVFDDGEAAGYRIEKFALNGFARDMAEAVLAHAGHRLDKLGLPIEIEIEPPSSGRDAMAVLAIDEHGALRASKNWAEMTGTHTRAPNADLYSTPEKLWRVLRHAPLPPPSICWRTRSSICFARSGCVVMTSTSHAAIGSATVPLNGYDRSLSVAGASIVQRRIWGDVARKHVRRRPRTGTRDAVPTRQRALALVQLREVGAAPCEVGETAAEENTKPGTYSGDRAVMKNASILAIRDRLHAAADANSTGAAFAFAFELDEGNPSSPVAWLRARLGLTETESLVLWVVLAYAVDPASRRYFRELDGETLLDPSVDTVRRLVYGKAALDVGAWRELGSAGALSQYALVEWIDASGPEHRRTLRVASRVLALLYGDVSLDPELAGCATLAIPSSPGSLEIAPGVRESVAIAIAAGGSVIVHGATGTGRRSLLATLAEEQGHALLQVDARALSTDRDKLKRQLRIVARECRLLGVVPLLLHLDALAAVGDVSDRLDVVEAELAGLVLATASRSLARRWRRPPAIVEMPALSGTQLAALWSRVLPQASPGDADLLATMYPLAPALVEAVGTVARREAADGDMRPEHIEAGVRVILDDRLAGLAVRLDITQTWDDLVLPEEQTTAVVELLARIRRRRRVYEDWGFAKKLAKGLGVSALFSGPPGTGKSMCAGLIARDLRTEVYQVDVSKISSKWIGESEKNLAALFDAAEAGHAILLFDEADALFGKRTAVTSSNDHHANQQVNYLLQRLESFTGICILTTNNDAALDEAFRRRLSVHIRFAMPDADERAKLWRAMLPPTAPVAPDLPFGDLARKYSMSGGYIRNAVLRAAFLAADEDDAISAVHLTQAAQLEYEAMGKLVAN